MNRGYDFTTAVCVSSPWSGGLRVLPLPSGSWHGLPRWQHGHRMRCVVPTHNDHTERKIKPRITKKLLTPKPTPSLFGSVKMSSKYRSRFSETPWNNHFVQYYTVVLLYNELACNDFPSVRKKESLPNLFFLSVKIPRV